MTTLAFVLFWIIAAVGLVFAALSGGPRGARERLHTQSSRGRRTALVSFAIALLGLGIALPAGVIAGEEGRDDQVTDSSIKLSKHEQRGRELFGERCRICHTLRGANAVAQVGPNLDNMRPPKKLVLDAIKNGRARGNGAMAADLVEGDDADAVASFVSKVAGRIADPDDKD